MECFAYKRHVKPCGYSDPQKQIDCRCGVYARGTLPGGEVVRRVALHTSDMPVGRKIVRKWVQNGTSVPLADPRGNTAVSIESAVATFLASREGLGLAQATNEKFTTMLGEFVEFCTGSAINKFFLVDIDNATLVKFRNTWKTALIVNSLKQGRLKNFFRYCVGEGWIAADKNPAARLKYIKYPKRQKLAYEPEEVARIWSCIDRPDDDAPNNTIMRAFILLIRWSGLRISDAVVVKWSNFTLRDDGEVWIDVIAQKNEEQITFPLNPVAVEAMQAVPRDETDFVLWRGDMSPFDPTTGRTTASAKKTFSAPLLTITKRAGFAPKTAGAHRYRHTCAVEALKEGFSSEEVARMLGDDVQTIIDSYSSWPATRQAQFARRVASQWRNPLSSSAPVVPSAPAPSPHPHLALLRRSR